jgi:hypothetical protein
MFEASQRVFAKSPAPDARRLGETGRHEHGRADILGERLQARRPVDRRADDRERESAC